jgi:dynein heavy chain 1
VTFRSQMSTIIGDVLLSSAFLAYAGYFDQHVSEYIDGSLKTGFLCLGLCNKYFF